MLVPEVTLPPRYVWLGEYSNSQFPTGWTSQGWLRV